MGGKAADRTMRLESGGAEGWFDKAGIRDGTIGWFDKSRVTGWSQGWGHRQWKCGNTDNGSLGAWAFFCT